jgi:hypothetical protein
MDHGTIRPDPEPVKPSAPRYIRRREHRRRLGDISKSTERKLLLTDPDHPRLVEFASNMKVYVESESDRYREILRSRREAALAGLDNGGGEKR